MSILKGEKKGLTFLYLYVAVPVDALIKEASVSELFKWFACTTSNEYLTLLK